MQIRYFPTRCDAGGTQRTHHCDAASRTAARDGLRNGISSVQPTRRSINRQPPNPCSTHASPICMTISPSAIAECKRILAIHIYRSTALPPALARPPVRPSVQSVRFQQRPLPSAFCSTSILSCAHARPLSFSLSLSLSLSLGHRFSRLCVSASPLRPPFSVIRPFAAAWPARAFSRDLRCTCRCRRQSALGAPSVKGQRRDGGIESFVRRRSSVTRRKIFALLSITSSGKLKFSVALGQRPGDMLMTTVPVPMNYTFNFY